MKTRLKTFSNSIAASTHLRIVLFVNDSPQAEIKLIDFGLSKLFGNEELTDGVGTIYTLAPEVLKGKYSTQADLWSVGVIAYVSTNSPESCHGLANTRLITSLSRCLVSHGL